MKKEKSSRNSIRRFLFLCYCVLMLWLLFFSGRTPDYANYWAQLKSNFNLRPFHTISNYLFVLFHGSSGYLVRHCAVNLIGNVVLFLPGGYFFPKLWRRFRPFWRFLLFSFSLLLLIECLQLLTLRGRFDVDDLLLNLLGLSMGYLFSLRK